MTLSSIVSPIADDNITHELRQCKVDIHNYLPNKQLDSANIKHDNREPGTRQNILYRQLHPYANGPSSLVMPFIVTSRMARLT